MAGWPSRRGPAHTEAALEAAPFADHAAGASLTARLGAAALALDGRRLDAPSPRPPLLERARPHPRGAHPRRRHLESWEGSAAAGREIPTALATVVDVDLTLQSVGAGWSWSLAAKSPPTVKLFDGAGATRRRHRRRHRSRRLGLTTAPLHRRPNHGLAQRRPRDHHTSTRAPTTPRSPARCSKRLIDIVKVDHRRPRERGRASASSTPGARSPARASCETRRAASPGSTPTPSSSPPSSLTSPTNGPATAFGFATRTALGRCIGSLRGSGGGSAGGVRGATGLRRGLGGLRDRRQGSHGLKRGECFERRPRRGPTLQNAIVVDATVRVADPEQRRIKPPMAWPNDDLRDHPLRRGLRQPSLARPVLKAPHRHRESPHRRARERGRAPATSTPTARSSPARASGETRRAASPGSTPTPGLIAAWLPYGTITTSGPATASGFATWTAPGAVT